ncbi:MAG: hypothetical protein RIB71_18265 [Imperialibacter sp.]|uniref:hypothetical protein n=1 Tax=Imperialibacter sp. TaxID=2038411 RepID=UPI0032EA966C
MKHIMILIVLLVSAQKNFSQDYGFSGVNNNPSVDADFANGSEQIGLSIKENLSNLNLYEYAHSLPELYDLMESGEVTIQQWRTFVDSLEQTVVMHLEDTIRPYWAVQYLGLIPLQAQFFLASLEKSNSLRARYPDTYILIKENTPVMEGLGYKRANLDSLVTFTDVVGTSTFWYFLQLFGCDLVRELQQTSANAKNKVILKLQNTTVVSTYKTPFFLQKRKLQSIQRSLESGDDCSDLSNILFQGTGILIKDDDRNYFSDKKKEGIDFYKVKTF